MYKRLLMVIVFGLLACGSVLGQETGVARDSLAKPGAQTVTSFQLKGVLISSSSRSALVNGHLVQEGDRISGLEVLAIEQSGVRVLAGARELTVDVGGTFVWDQSSSNVATNSRKRAPQSGHQGQSVAARAASARETGSRLDARHRHAVQAGETLSGIAARYLEDGVTMNQMMIAMFQANEQAFDDNINVLYAGANLRIPGQNELHQHSPDTATAEVARHRDMWRPADPQAIKIANSSDNEYGPVESGETLSDIAASLLHDGTTVNQMMIALFQANPQAFSHNINVLHQGAILRIPDETELYRHTPEMATTEVVRQTKAWQDSDERHALLTLAHNNVIASGHELIE